MDEKSYNPDSFHAQMKFIWKTKKKFDIKVAGQNLFLIEFEALNDLESIFEGRPWLFHKQVIFYRFSEPIECAKVILVKTLLWLKVGPYHLDCDMKDLAHAMGFTFRGLLRFEFTDYYCHLRVMVDV